MINSTWEASLDIFLEVLLPVLAIVGDYSNQDEDGWTLLQTSAGKDLCILAFGMGGALAIDPWVRSLPAPTPTALVLLVLFMAHILRGRCRRLARSDLTKWRAIRSILYGVIPLTMAATTIFAGYVYGGK